MLSGLAASLQVFGTNASNSGVLGAILYRSRPKSSSDHHWLKRIEPKLESSYRMALGASPVIPSPGWSIRSVSSCHQDVYPSSHLHVGTGTSFSVYHEQM